MPILLQPWRWPMPVAYKIGLVSSLIMLLGIAVLTALVTHYQLQMLNKQVDALGNIIASQFAASVTEPLFTDDTMGLQVQVFQLAKDERIQGAAIIDESGAVLAEAGDIKVFTQPETPLRDPFALYKRLTEGSVTVSSPVQFDGVVAGYVLVDFVPVEVSRSVESMLAALFYLASLMVVLLMLVAFMISRKMAKPIRHLVEATRRIGDGHYDIDIAYRGKDEIGVIAHAINSMSQGLRQKRRVEGVLNRVVAREVAEKLLSKPDDGSVSCERVEATVLFVDIVGFTSLSEQRTPEEVVGLLNDYFGYFTLCGQLFFGSVDKFIGDCAMILFGTPKPNEDHRFNAISTAIAIQRLMKVLNEQRKILGEPPVEVRIGLNTGEMMAGTVGVAQRMEYTVIGDPVNLASRLSNLADPGTILAGESVVKHRTIDDKVSYISRGEVSVKGKTAICPVVQILDIGPEYLRVVDHLIDDILTKSAEYQPRRSRKPPVNS